MYQRAMDSSFKFAFSAYSLPLLATIISSTTIPGLRFSVRRHVIYCLIVCLQMSPVFTPVSTSFWPNWFLYFYVLAYWMLLLWRRKHFQGLLKPLWKFSTSSSVSRKILVILLKVVKLNYPLAWWIGFPVMLSAVFYPNQIQYRRLFLRLAARDNTKDFTSPSASWRSDEMDMVCS